MPRIRGRKERKEVFALLRRKRDTSAGAVKQINVETRFVFSLCSSSFSRSLSLITFLELSLCFACVRLDREHDVQWKLTPSTRAHAHITHLLASSSIDERIWKKKKKTLRDTRTRTTTTTTIESLERDVEVRRLANFLSLFRIGKRSFSFSRSLSLLNADAPLPSLSLYIYIRR